MVIFASQGFYLHFVPYFVRKKQSGGRTLGLMKMGYEVQICIKSVGVCGSDVHFWQDGKIGDAYVVTSPMLLGHEDIGERRDRVAIEPHGVCRMCDACRNGRYNLCPNVFFLAAPPDDGAIARYFTHGADFVFKLPDNVSFDEGALIEPLSVGLHACRRARVTLGDRVLVCGAGPVGLCAMLAARAFGASAVCMTDINVERLEFARKVGATHTLKIEKGEESEGVAKKIVDLLGDAPNRAIECSGATFSVHLGVNALKPGGVFVLVGMGPTVTTFPIVNVIAKEIEIIGSIRYIHTWPTAIDMLSCGAINIAPLVSHRYKLEQTLEAFEKAKSGEGVKIMIDCSKN